MPLLNSVPCCLSPVPPGPPRAQFNFSVCRRRVVQRVFGLGVYFRDHWAHLFPSLWDGMPQTRSTFKPPRVACPRPVEFQALEVGYANVFQARLLPSPLGWHAPGPLSFKPLGWDTPRSFTQFATLVSQEKYILENI
jgi:hypothetical protein